MIRLPHFEFATDWSRKESKTIIVGLCLLFALLAIAYVFVGAICEDEGWYLTAGKMVFAGEVLYRDFMYTQAPILPYVYGAVGLLIDAGVYTGRFTSFGFALLAALLLTLAAYRLQGYGAACVALAAMALNPMVLYHLTITKTYSLAFLLVSASLFSLLLRSTKTVRYILCTLALCLATGVRLSIAAAVPTFLLTLLLFERQGVKHFLLNLSVAAPALALIFGPFFLLDAEATWFNLVGFHTVTYHSSSLFQVIYEKLENLGFFVNNLSFLLVAISFGLAHFWVRRHRPLRSTLEKEFTYIQIGAVTAAILAANLAPRAMRWDYFIVCTPGLVLLASCAVAKLYQIIGQPSERAILTSVVAVFLMLNALAGYHNLDIRGASLPLAEVSQVARLIASHTGENDKLLTFRNYVAIESGRDLLPGLEMGVFSYYPEWDRTAAERYGVVNDEIFREYLTDARAAAVMVTVEDFQRSSTLKHLDREERRKNAERMFELIGENYRLKLTVAAFGQWKETLYVYFRSISRSPATVPLSGR